LAWDRQVTKFGGSDTVYDPSNQFSAGLNDLDLYLMPQNWQELGYSLGDEHTIAESIAGDSTVEHIFKSVLPGMYEIVVHHFGGIGTDQDYALAWWMGTDTGATTIGDFDSDGDVDGRDFLAWQRGNSPTPLSASDLADWQGNYGFGALAATTAVPEPGCLALLFPLAFLLRTRNAA
jgi:hypothetical protein